MTDKADSTSDQSATITVILKTPKDKHEVEVSPDITVKEVSEFIIIIGFYFAVKTFCSLM